MNPTLIKTLEGIGLDSKEAAVYIACLELAGAPASAIASKAGLNRVTAYEVLKRLAARGAVSKFEKSKVHNFAAVEPEVLLRQAAERLAAAKELLPQLSALANLNLKKPQIYFYEGIEGIKAIYEDSLSAKTEILTFTNPTDIYEALGRRFMDSYVKERARRGISVRGLAPDSPAGKEAALEAQDVLRKVKLFPAADHDVRNEIMIYDDTIALFSGADQIGMLIRNPSLAATFRSIWEMSWQNADSPSIDPERF